MPDTGPTSERLEALRARWEAEPDSRVFLQLADEYRRLGRTEEAARVLEEGLAANPHHLAAQVALGRCRLDLGAPDEAAGLLERVVENDPTQMVAYRLLVEAYLRQGRAEEARQRLRIYGLLNDADPEIAELRRRIGELDRQPAAATAAPPEQPEPAVEAADEPWMDAGEEPWAEAAAEPEEPWAEAAPDPEPAHAEPAPAPASASLQAVDAPAGDPFPGLSEPSSRRRYLEALAAGGVFEVAAPELAAPELEVPEEEAPAPAPRALAPDEVFDLEAPAAAGPDLSSLLEPEAGPAPEAAPEPGARPTVTLGRLYLRQGHTSEAAEIFREVLARDPGNDEARRHLEELERPPEAASPPPPEPVELPEPVETPDTEPAEEAPPPAVEARELLAGYPGDEGLTGRKRYVLERYLERLRGRARRDVH